MIGRWLMIAGAGLAALGLVALWIWGPSQTAWQALFWRLESWGPWIGVALIGLMILHNVVPVPAELIAVTAGATMGLVPGVVVIWIGAMIGAVLAFWVARRFGRVALAGSRTARHLSRFDRFVTTGDWPGMIAVRLLPIVSFNLVNYAAGLADVRWGRFVWTTAVGILPITVLSVAAGAGLSMVGGYPALMIIAAAILAVLLWRWRKTARR